MLKNKNTIIITFLFFLFWLITLSFTPLSGDDWNNYLIGSQGFKAMFDNAIMLYQNWEGRFISRLFISFFTYYRYSWIIVNSLIMTGGYYIMLKIIKSKSNKLVIYGMLLSILLIERSIFTQTYLWRAGNITYMFCMFLVLLYLSYINPIFDKEFNKKQWWKILLWSLFNFISVMFVENGAACLITINLLATFYYYFKYNKLNTTFISSLITNIIGFAIMYFSPGNTNRLNLDNADFNNLSLFNKIMINLPNFINWTFCKNIVVIILFLIIMNYIIKNYYKGIIKFILIIFINVIPLLTIFIKLLTYVNKAFDVSVLIKSIMFITDSNHFYIIIYWLLFLLFFIYLVINYINQYQQVLFYLLIALSANGAMLLAPIWGGRVALFTVYLLYLTLFIIINELKLPITLISKLGAFVSSITLCTALVLLFAYYNVMLCVRDRENQIIVQLKTNNNPITIIYIPDILIHNGSPVDEFGNITFKNYYGINQNTDIEIDTSYWQKIIFYKKR